MRFEQIILELEKYQSLDIIAASPDPEGPTEPTTDPLLGTAPYANDKW